MAVDIDDSEMFGQVQRYLAERLLTVHTAECSWLFSSTGNEAHLRGCLSYTVHLCGKRGKDCGRYHDISSGFVLWPVNITRP